MGGRRSCASGRGTLTGKSSIVRIASVAGAALAMICLVSMPATAAPAAPTILVRPQSLNPGGPPAGAAAAGCGARNQQHRFRGGPGSVAPE